MPPEADPKDPRFRTYRRVVLGVFFVVCAAFSGLIIVSVVRSVWAMSPPPLPPADPTLTFRECIDSADALWRDLDQHRQTLSSQSPVRGSEKDWYGFRVDWLKRFREAESHCALNSHSRERLSAVYARLFELVDVYTTSAVQYTGQVGPAVDGLAEAFAQARQDPAAGRF